MGTYDLQGEWSNGEIVYESTGAYQASKLVTYICPICQTYKAITKIALNKHKETCLATRY